MAKLRRLRRWVNLRKGFQKLGGQAIAFFSQCGQVFLFLTQTLGVMLSTRPKWSQLVYQMHKIGVTSLPLVSLTSIFTGMVLALQSAYQLRYLQAVEFTADLVALSITRELGPVLTAMVVAGRVGAGMTAELGSMKVTEQIDALESLAVDPIRFLVVPRFVAAVLMLFMLTIYSDFIGMLGGYVVGVFKLGIASEYYIKRTVDSLVLKDIFSGLIKAFFFGVIISIIGCFHGFRAKGGAEGVGKATTVSVVTALVLVISFDCLATAFFYFVF